MCYQFQKISHCIKALEHLGLLAENQKENFRKSWERRKIEFQKGQTFLGKFTGHPIKMAPIFESFESMAENYHRGFYFTIGQANVQCNFFISTALNGDLLLFDCFQGCKNNCLCA